MYEEVINSLLNSKAFKATKYVTPNKIIRVVRTRYGSKFLKGNIEMTVTIGRPNFLERKFVKLCVESGEGFPVKKVQLKFPPKAVIKISKKRL